MTNIITKIPDTTFNDEVDTMWDILEGELLLKEYFRVNGSFKIEDY